jgi:RNA polymerase sigma-70 factor (ECF subfamily)
MQGDAAALGEIFSEYGVRLCAYAYRWTQSREIAEELVHDVFLSIWTHHEQWEIQTSVKTYLFRATHNRVLNFLRSRGVQHRFELTDVETDQSFVSKRPEQADELMHRAELHDAIREAIDALPEKTREVFLLNREQELTYAEIATLLGVSSKTVEYHMGRAFAGLRRHLSAWAPAA